MKKRNSIICMILLLGLSVLVISASSPSLDGRAVVADEGVLPSGLFAKTVGYLPGDNVSVTNPLTGKIVQILVIGSLDPSEGVAILLTPEAADALGIKKNSSNIVKLTKRSGQLDEIVSGTAVIAQSEEISAQTDATTQEEQPDTTVTEPEKTTVSPAVAEETSVPSADEEPTDTTEIAKSAEVTDSAETMPVEKIEADELHETKPEVAAEDTLPESTVVNESETIPDSEAAEQTVTEEKIDEMQPDNTAAVSEEAVTEETPAEQQPEAENPGTEAVEEKVPEQPIEDTAATKQVAEEEVPTDQQPAVSETSFADKISEPEVTDENASDSKTASEKISDTNIPEVAGNTSEDKINEPKVEDEQVAEKSVPSEKVEAVVPTETPETEQPEPEKITTEEIPPSEKTAAQPVEKEPINADDSEEETAEVSKEPELEEISTDIVPASTDEKPAPADSEAYKPIILSPTALNPPVPEQNTETDTKPAEPEKTTAVAETVNASEEQIETTPSEAPDSFGKYTAASMEKLETEKYYVQIAVLGDKENIQNLIKKYGNNYPIILVPSASGTAYNVLLGPLTNDEYGSVLLQFKAKGFKDSFVRKILKKE